MLLRRTKIPAAFALAVVVGVGAYAATYRVLVVVSPTQPQP